MSRRTPSDARGASLAVKPHLVVVHEWHSVERPSDGLATGAEVAPELLVDLLADINVVHLAARALVADGSLDGLAVAVDGDGLAALGVAVGLGTHEAGGQGNNVLRVVLARVVLTASAEADSVVSDVARLVAAAAAARAGSAGGSLGLGARGSGRRRRRRRGGSSGRSRGRRRRSSRGSAGGRRRRRSGGRGLLRLLGGGRGRLEELGVRGMGDDNGRVGGRDRLAGGDPDGGAGVDDLGHVLDLGNPLDLGDGDDIARVDGVGGSDREEGGGGDSKGLHVGGVGGDGMVTWLSKRVDVGRGVYKLMR